MKILVLIQKIIKIFCIFLIILLEVISYKYNLIVKINYFVAAILWFHILSFILGLTSKEYELRIKKPIKFQFSLNYLFKLIKRGIYDKQKTILELFLIILIISVSFLIVRYFRWHLLFEVFTTFNIKENFIVLLTVISFSIVECYTWIIGLLNPKDPFEYKYLVTENNKNGVKLKDKISDYTGITISYMKKAVTELIPIARVPKTIIKSDIGFSLPEYIKGSDYGYKKVEVSNMVKNKEKLMSELKIRYSPLEDHNNKPSKKM